VRGDGRKREQDSIYSESDRVWSVAVWRAGFRTARAATPVAIVRRRAGGQARFDLRQGLPPPPRRRLRWFAEEFR
jgi:hypothetical protein